MSARLIESFVRLVKRNRIPALPGEPAIRLGRLAPDAVKRRREPPAGRKQLGRRWATGAVAALLVGVMGLVVFQSPGETASDCESPAAVNRQCPKVVPAISTDTFVTEDGYCSCNNEPVAPVETRLTAQPQKLRKQVLRFAAGGEWAGLVPPVAWRQRPWFCFPARSETMLACLRTVILRT